MIVSSGAFCLVVKKQADRQVEGETGGRVRGGGGALMGLSITLLLSIHTDKNKDVFL